MLNLNTTLVAAGTAFFLSACQTIPYNDAVYTTVSEYAVGADRHIVAMGTAWNKCYEAYDLSAQDTDRRFVLSKDTAVAVILATDIDDTTLTDRDALKVALDAVIDQNLVDQLARIEEPFRGYLEEVVSDLNLDPIVRGITSRLIAPAAAGQSEQERRDAVIEDVLAFMFDEGLTARAQCSEAAFADLEEDFYDDWSSKLFAVQQLAKADDALGLCSKVAGMVKEHADKVNKAILKSRFASLSFDSGTECSLATIGGVLLQHENLRQAHKDLVILDRDTGQFWRETIAQSVRIAVTIEKFKQSAAEDSGDLI